jgi:hypothetical protein
MRAIRGLTALIVLAFTIVVAPAKAQTVAPGFIVKIHQIDNLGATTPLSVSCWSRTACVGASLDGGLDTYDGTSWVRTNAFQHIVLDHVRCFKPGKCVAVTWGSALVRNSASGAWRLHRIRMPKTTLGFITDLSCSSMSHCLAVGEYDVHGGRRRPIAEFWDGTAWHRLPLPVGATRFAMYEYSSVSCMRTRCVIVGFTRRVLNGSSTGMQFGVWHAGRPSMHAITFSARWHGASVDSLKCFQGPRCVGVGEYFTFTGFNEHAHYLSAVLRVNSWHVTTIPTRFPPVDADPLESPEIQCSSTRSCLAFSEYERGNPESLDRYFPEARRWNGLKWTRVPVAGSSRHSETSGLSCPSSTFCVATGYEVGPAHDFTTTWTLAG